MLNAYYATCAPGGSFCYANCALTSLCRALSGTSGHSMWSALCGTPVRFTFPMDVVLWCRHLLSCIIQYRLQYPPSWLSTPARWNIVHFWQDFELLRLSSHEQLSPQSSGKMDPFLSCTFPCVFHCYSVSRICAREGVLLFVCERMRSLRVSLTEVDFLSELRVIVLCTCEWFSIQFPGSVSLAFLQVKNAVFITCHSAYAIVHFFSFSLIFSVGYCQCKLLSDILWR